MSNIYIFGFLTVELSVIQHSTLLATLVRINIGVKFTRKCIKKLFSVLGHIVALHERSERSSTAGIFKLGFLTSGR